jgi:hypothetical protein
MSRQKIVPPMDAAAEKAVEPIVKGKENTQEPLVAPVIDDNVIKVNLDKPPVSKTDAPIEKKDDAILDEIKEEEPVVKKDDPIEKADDAADDAILEEIVDNAAGDDDATGDKDKVVDKKVIEDVEEIIDDAAKTGKKLPENIQKLVDFMEDTNGSIEDYVMLNKDNSLLNEDQLLKEYYKSTKKHLDSEEVDFLLEDTFSFDEDLDSDRDIKRKKLAKKEEVAKAKDHLDGLKTKYYDDIKAGSKLTEDQRKAVDFFDRYNKDSEETSKVATKRKTTFASKTEELFNNEFKGFEYEVGDKKYRFNVKNVSEVKNSQSDINNFAKKFLGEDQSLKDAKGYHKSLFTAMNADAVANHFYQQGKTDAIKDSLAKAKNIDMAPNIGHQPFVSSDGFKAKVVSGDDSSKLRIKLKT